MRGRFLKKNSCWIIWLGSRWMHPSPPAAPILSAFRNFAFRAIAIVGGSCGRGRPNGVKTLLSPHGVSHAEGVERNAAAEFGGGGGLSKSGIRFFRPLQARPLGRGPTTQMPCRSLPAVRATLCLLVDCAGRMTQPHVEISQPGGAGGRAGGRAGGWISSHRREGGGAEGICGLPIPLPRHSTPPPPDDGGTTTFLPAAGSGDPRTANTAAARASPSELLLGSRLHRGCRLHRQLPDAAAPEAAPAAGAAAMVGRALRVNDLPLTLIAVRTGSMGLTPPPPPPLTTKHTRTHPPSNPPPLQ